MTGERYTLTIAPSARRQIAEQLPGSVAFAAHEFIVGPLLDNPHRVGKRLQPSLADRHSARRGTYRVIYRIDDRRRTVTVVGVLPRADATQTAFFASKARDHSPATQEPAPRPRSNGPPGHPRTR